MIRMIWLFVVLLSSHLCCAEQIHEYVVKVKSGFSGAKALAKRNGMILSHKMMGFDDYYVLRRNMNIQYLNNHFVLNRLKRSIGVEEIEEQIVLKRTKRDYQVFRQINFNDPLYSNQWYLIRSMKNPKEYDMNVMEAWKLGYTGKGIVVSILDDGIDHRHTDLHENYDPKASYDINDKDKDPLYNLKNPSSNKHGTRCAGEVSAVANNKMCGVGVAFKSSIGAVRMLDGQVTDRVEAEALSLNQQHIDIYSASWGPDDDGKKLEGPNKFAKLAFERGVKFGRGGKGNVFVWASGNGGMKGDSCACDGYASSVYTFSVSSVAENNRKPWYLEKCASTLATTYSSGSKPDRKIITTDVNNMCTQYHTGTSASAPLAAGIIALLLEANKNLTWRDVQYITVVTANPRPFLDGAFLINGANRPVSNTYGFGLMDAGKMVRLGKLWKTLPDKEVCTLQKKVMNTKIYSNFKLKGSVQIGKCKVNFVEHVVLRMRLSFSRRGALKIIVISPSGTRSEIFPPRSADKKNGNTMLDVWPLMTVQFWGELSSGDWSVEVLSDNREYSATYYNGFWSWFQLEIHGTEQWPLVLKRSPTKKENYDQWFDRFYRIIDRSIEYRTRPIPADDGSNSPKRNKCHRACAANQCTGTSRKQCTKCNKYTNYDGVCVNECPVGTFVSQTNSSVCVKCHFSCYSCRGPSKQDCIRCHEYDSFNKGSSGVCKSAINGCDIGTYFDSVNKVCKRCPGKCEACINGLRCSICKPGFALTLNQQCKPSCEPGSFNNGFGVCHLCPQHCSTCTLPFNYDPIIKSKFLPALSLTYKTAYCTSCKPPDTYEIPVLKFRDSNSHPANKIVGCVSSCPPGYIIHPTTQTCTKCNPVCETCEPYDTNKCIKCRTPFVMVNSTCSDSVEMNCRPNEFKSGDKCVKCAKQCATCSTISQCTRCSKQYPYQYMRECVSQCPSGSMPHPELGVCVPCDYFCREPANKSIEAACTKFCSRSRSSSSPNVAVTMSPLLDSNSNSTVATTNTEYNSTLCTSNGLAWDSASSRCVMSCSSPACAQCTLNPKHCVKCSGKSVFDTGSHSCLSVCPATVPFMQSQDRACLPCPLSCGPHACHSDGSCTKCPLGHTKNPTQQCSRVITCGFDHFWNKQQETCEKCNANCWTCSKQTECNSCSRGFCLDSQSRQCKKCCLISNDVDCLRCDPDSELCFQTPIIRNAQKDSSSTITQMIIVISVLLFVVVTIVVLLFYNHNRSRIFNSSNANNNAILSNIHYHPLLSNNYDDDDDDDDEDKENQEIIEFIRPDKNGGQFHNKSQSAKNHVTRHNENGYTYLPKEDALKSNGSLS